MESASIKVILFSKDEIYNYISFCEMYAWSYDASTSLVEAAKDLLY